MQGAYSRCLASHCALVCPRIRSEAGDHSPPPLPETEAPPPSPMPDEPFVRLKAGGSPYLEYQNSCMQAAKRTASQSDLTAKGTLTDTARRTVVKTCQETWARMDAGQKGLYLDLYRERRKERAQQLGQAAASRRADSIASSSFSCTSSWGVGSRHCAVHPVMIQQAFQQGQRLPSYSEVYNPDEFYIKDGLGGELLGADNALDGCPVQRRNVCRTSQISKRWTG